MTKKQKKDFILGGLIVVLAPWIMYKLLILIML